MATQRTLTAANSTFTLAVEGIFPVPVKIQGYSTDAAFEMDAVEGAEVMKGVDNLMSAGWVPSIKQQTITLQADSPSATLFETWVQAMDSAREVIWCDGVIVQPGLGQIYTLTRGVLRNYSRMSSVRRTMQPRPFIIAWTTVVSAPYVL